MIISKYSGFYSISFRDLRPEIQPFEKERWKLNWYTFHHYKLCRCMDECTCPLLECCEIAENWTTVFFTSFFNDCISGCRYPNEMGTIHCIQKLVKLWSSILIIYFLNVSFLLIHPVLGIQMIYITIFGHWEWSSFRPISRGIRWVWSNP